MGGCLGLNRSGTGVTDNTTDTTRTNSVSGAYISEKQFSISLSGTRKPFTKFQSSHRKNLPLCHEGIRWKSDVPLTEGQLRSKRDEFWDTAPAFDGRKEIWDALRAAAVAGESKDYEHAQAILDGANISVPNGYLTECYDELGTRYQVPVYCLSYPINIVKEDGRDSPADNAECGEGGSECLLKLRLSSSCADIKLTASSKDTIGMVKKKLQQQEGFEPTRQRWYFGGKLLSDKLRIEETKIQPGYVIQVVMNPEPIVSTNS